MPIRFGLHGLRKNVLNGYQQFLYTHCWYIALNCAELRVTVVVANLKNRFPGKGHSP